MNRVVISVPRVLDSAVITLHDAEMRVATGNLPATAQAPFTVTQVQAIPTETQLHDLTVTPLSEHSQCARVTGTVTVPLSLTITDTNNAQFQTQTSADHAIDIVLYVPADAAFPYQITSEGCIHCSCCHCDGAQTVLQHASCQILTRVTATTDLLIPSYGYAPINPAENYYNTQESHQNLALFPRGKVY